MEFSLSAITLGEGLFCWRNDNTFCCAKKDVKKICYKNGKKEKSGYPVKIASQVVLFCSWDALVACVRGLIN